MAANFVQDGKTITKTVSGTKSAGDPEAIGATLGVYLNDYTSGQQGVLATEGVWNLTKTVATAFTQGQAVFWDTSTEVLVAATTTSTLRAGGIVWEAAGSGTVEAPVKINAVSQKAAGSI